MFLAGDDGGGDDDENATVGAFCRAQAVSGEDRRELLCSLPLTKAVLVCTAPPWICY